MNKTESVAGKATRRMQLKNMPLDRFETELDSSMQPDAIVSWMASG